MEYNFFAFISYSTADIAWGKRLHRKLEHYRMPSTLCSEHKWKTKTPMRPIFFAPADIQPGDLSKELKHRLDVSRYLIVICSPDSAKSDWVAKEVDYFYSLGRTNNIYFFIVSGTPNSKDDSECFNPIFAKLGLSTRLGVNINEKIYRFPWMNRERAYIQLITKLLGIEFDTLWNRHRRLLIKQIISYAVVFVAVVAAIMGASLISRPIDVKVGLNEITAVNANLPALKSAQVSLILENERKDTTFTSIDQRVVFSNIPANVIGKKVQVHFSAENYLDLDTTLMLADSVILNVSRDRDAYGHVRFTLYDSHVKPMPGKKIFVQGIEAVSDDNGLVDVIIPISDQNVVYTLTSDEVVFLDSLKDAKCGSSDAVMTK